MINNWQLLKLMMQRELMLNVRQLKMIFNVALFFIIFMVIFPLSMPADPQMTRKLAAGLIWMASLFSFMLAADRVFTADYEQGVIEQWLVSGYSLPLIVFAKLLFHWMLSLLPLLLLMPFMGLLYSLSFNEIIIFMAALFCGTAPLIFIAALASVFALAARQGSHLAPLILLPLTIPVIIFGSGASSAAISGLPVSGFLAILAAISLITVCLLPFAIATVIRISLAD